jgi:lipoprotein NlpD
MSGILVGPGCSTPQPAPVASREPLSPATPYYRVKRGDTLAGIAWRAGLDYRVLAAWNDIRNPDRIYAGQLLRMQPPLRSNRSGGSPGVKPRASRSPGPQPKTRVPDVATTRKAGSAEPAVVTASPQPVRGRDAVLHWRWPTDGRLYRTFSGNDRKRRGIKIRGVLGQPIRAAEAGRIVYSGSGLIGYGKLIIIKHNKNYLSAYGHNRRILVKEGDRVVRGETIGEMGKPPDDEPLLHFEIRRGGTPVDPMSLLPRRG